MHDGVQLFMSCFSFEQAWGPTIRGYSRRVVLPLVLSGIEKFTATLKSMLSMVSYI